MGNMKIPDRETVERLRKEYPVGCRIVLDAMDDGQAPKSSMQGTVLAVDDCGSIIPAWDSGGRLSIVYGIDRCHKICNEEEAKETLNFYGSRQPVEDARCPRCGARMEGKTSRHALSRQADITVCDACGTFEALEAAGMMERIPLTEWTAIKEPQEGAGEWEG